MIALCSLILVACGGGDTTTDTTQGTPLSHEEFVAQADAICQAGDDAIDAGSQQLGSNPSQADLDAFVEDTLIPNLTDQLNQIDALGAPEGEAEQVSAITSALSDGIDQLEQDPSSATKGNVGAFEQANELAQDYGLTACGNG